MSIARSLRFLVVALGWLAALLLSGCSLFAPGPPAQSEQTNLDLLVRASPGLNPNAQGQPAPMLVRIYELRAWNVFQEADFFALYNTDRSTLSTDLLAVDQAILRPGETYTLKRKSNPETRVIGVLAGYRDLPRSTWRALYLLPQPPEARWYRSVLPNQSAELQIDLQANAVLITERRQSRSAAQPNDPRPNTAPLGNTPVPAIPSSTGLQNAQPPAPGAIGPASAGSPGLPNEIQNTGKTVQDTSKAVTDLSQTLPDKSALDTLKDPGGGLLHLIGK